MNWRRLRCQPRAHRTRGGGASSDPNRSRSVRTTLFFGARVRTLPPSKLCNCRQMPAPSWCRAEARGACEASVGALRSPRRVRPGGFHMTAAFALPPPCRAPKAPFVRASWAHFAAFHAQSRRSRGTGEGARGPQARGCHIQRLPAPSGRPTAHRRYGQMSRNEREGASVADEMVSEFRNLLSVAAWVRSSSLGYGNLRLLDTLVHSRPARR